jgi:hypothetical protein
MRIFKRSIMKNNPIKILKTAQKLNLEQYEVGSKGDILKRRTTFITEVCIMLKSESAAEVLKKLKATE